jgi:DNA-binding transcriptional regulator YhcF (GntR family)
MAAQLLKIDLGLPDPAYQQITRALRALLAAGDLEAGDALPTVRQLAMDLGVHHNTVAQAYRLLAEEGWVDLKRRRGARVRARTTPRRDPRAAKYFLRRVRELAAEARAGGVPGKEIALALRDLATESEGSS